MARLYLRPQPIYGGRVYLVGFYDIDNNNKPHLTTPWVARHIGSIDPGIGGNRSRSSIRLYCAAPQERRADERINPAAKKTKRSSWREIIRRLIMNQKQNQRFYADRTDGAGMAIIAIIGDRLSELAPTPSPA